MAKDIPDSMNNMNLHFEETQQDKENHLKKKKNPAEKIQITQLTDNHADKTEFL